MPTAVPQPRRHWVSRPRLIDALMDWREFGLIEITARAGYGKTTLAGMLLHVLAAQPDAERPVTPWIALDASDGARDAFLRRVGDALQPHFTALAEAFALERDGEATAAHLIAECHRAFAAHPVHVLLVVDDCHLLCDDAREFLQHLIDGAPDSLHLLLLSRTPLVLRVSRRLLDRRVLRLEEEDLRLDHEEFERFIRTSSLANLSPAQHDDIERSSEGWILGLQLIAATPRARYGSPPTLGRSALLADFFDVDVLAALSPTMRRFLIDVAVLPTLTVDLAAAAAAVSTHECAALLEQAAASNVFVFVFAGAERMDERIETATANASVRYRLHPLFREHLLRQLGAGAADVRRRAAVWLADHGEVDAALDLLLPQLVEDAAAVVAEAGRRALLRHELADARRWMDRLPESAIASSPRLALDAAWLCIFSEGGDLGARVMRAHAALAAAGDDVPAEMHGDAAVLDAWRFFLEGDPDAARAAIDTASRLLGEAPSIPAAYVCILRALAQFDAPMETRAAALRRSIEIFQRVGYAHGAAIATSFLATLKLRYCNPAGALASFEHALGIVAGLHAGRRSLAAELRINRAEILLFMGRFDEARAEFAQAAEHTQVISYTPRVYMQLCDLYQHGAAVIDDEEDAATWASLVASSNPVMLAIVGLVRILRDHRLGRAERCWQTVESIGVFPHQLTPDFPDPITLMALAGAVLSGRAVQDLSAALQRAVAHMKATGNDWVALRLRIFQAIDARRCDGIGAERELRALHDEVGRLRLPFLLTPCESLRTQVRMQSEAPVVLESGFGLSQQEVRIMQLLAVGHSTKAIAAELYISSETVRTHLRRCFRKLDAHNRVDAVRKAREAGLLRG